MTGIGADKADLKELPRQSDRICFLYIEYCKVNRKDSGVYLQTDTYSVELPIATISVLLLGPGTSITHRAVELITDSGTSICWVGQDSLKCFATGSALTNTSRLAELQAESVSNMRKRLAVARKMYQMRFPNEDVSHLTMQQLRGREGARIRKVYRDEAKKHSIIWNGRNYNSNDIDDSDSVNAALSIANSCLYGIAYAVICSLGAIPSLGFVHTGHQRSFVYDLADLYKTETSIPVAFEVASKCPRNVWRETRTKMRDIIKSSHILERMVRDVNYLLDCEYKEDYSDVLALWDPLNDFVMASTQYARDD